MRVEVLVATMHQKDLSKCKEMNIQTDAVFANQDNRYEYMEKEFCGSKVKMITTAERGVGKNRNISLMHASADICLFADDDMIYVDDYEEIVKCAFKELPQAGIIIFNIESVGNNVFYRRINKKIRRINKFNALNYGAPRIAIRREEIIRKNIWFSMLYGGGAPYSAGEDSLFLIEAIKKGVKVYTYPKKIAVINVETSTWFKGYTEKYYFDKGMWLANAFPIMKYVFALYYTFRLIKSSDKSLIQILKLMLLGIRNFNEVKMNNE